MDVLYIPQLDEIGTGGEGEGGGSGSGTVARYRILRRVPEDGTVVYFFTETASDVMLVARKAVGRLET